MRTDPRRKSSNGKNSTLTITRGPGKPVPKKHRAMTTAEKNRANQITSINNRMPIRENANKIVDAMLADGFLLEEAEEYLTNLISEVIISKAASLHEKMING